MLYFCVRSLIVFGGEESLRNYAGFGGDNSQLSVPMKITLDALIEKKKDSQIKLAAEVNVEIDATSTLTHKRELQRLIRFIKYQRDFDNGDDDDDPGLGPSGGPVPHLPSFIEMGTVDSEDQPGSPGRKDDDQQTLIFLQKSYGNYCAIICIEQYSSSSSSSSSTVPEVCDIITSTTLDTTTG